MPSDKTSEKQGRGKGEGANYKPWIRTTEQKGQGRKKRSKSLKVNRIVHTFSTIETSLYELLELASNVIEIKEQYKLETQETKKICSKLKIKHPGNNTKTKIAVTFDFLITFSNGRKLAIAVKPINKILEKRVIEIFQIQASYADIKGYDFKIYTEKDIDKAFNHNIKLIKPYRDDKFFVENLKEKIQLNLNKDETTEQILSQIAKEMKFTVAKVKSGFYHLLVTKQIGFNFYKVLNMSRPIKTFYQL
jgi:hypothetical protein